MANKNEYCATERLYLDSKGKAVSASSPDRVSLLLVAGQCIPLDKAAQYGLVDEGSAPQGTQEAGGDVITSMTAPAQPDTVEAILEGGEPFVEDEEKEVKQKKGAPANKAVTNAPANKGKK